MAYENRPRMVRVGEAGWVERLRGEAEGFDAGYFEDFRPVSAARLDEVEREIRRELPRDYRLFMETFGWGTFRAGGGLYSPEDIVAACHGPVVMHTGWGMDHDEEMLRQFYITRGGNEPRPAEVQVAALPDLGFSLLDLVQIGTDGNCGYLQLHVGDAKKTGGLGFCLLHESEVYDRAASFSHGLHIMLTRHWCWANDILEDDMEEGT